MYYEWKQLEELLLTLLHHKAASNETLMHGFLPAGPSATVAPTGLSDRLSKTRGAWRESEWRVTLQSSGNFPTEHFPKSEPQNFNALTSRLTFPTQCVNNLHTFVPVSYSIYIFEKYEFIFVFSICFVRDTSVQNVSTLVQIHFIKCVNIFVLVSYSNNKDRYTKKLVGFIKTGRSSDCYSQKRQNVQSDWATPALRL